jgi:hypothetical protein
MKSIVVPIGLAVVLGAAAGACTAGVEDDAGAWGEGASASGGTEDASAGSFTTGSGGGPPGDCITCSADLHSIVDCEGNVIQTCPADQGCAPGGACVPACESAELNKSTIGCDFYSVTPAVIGEARGGCFAVMVANTWTAPVTVTAEYGGQTVDVGQHLYVPQSQDGAIIYEPVPDGQLPAGELGILFLSKYESGDVYQVDCPTSVTHALEQSTQVDATGIGSAFRIGSTAPVVMYDVYPWGGALSYVSSATLLLPTSTWDTNFVTADAWNALHGNPFTQIVAAEDDTTITMVPVAQVSGGLGVASMPPNVPTSFLLGRGEVAQLLQPQRLAGSVIQSDKPISVWGGSSCMNIPDNQVACDAAHQQLLPVQALGNEYVAVRYPPRAGTLVDAAPFTLVGMVDGTQLSYDPMPPGAVATLNRGQVAIFYTDQPFTVRSQDAEHPFYMASHMTGGASTSAGIGDPEYVNLVPPQQYLAKYLFATDPTYGNTALVFVRKRAKDGSFKDVTLDCIGPISGWAPVGSSGQYEAARVMMVEGFIGQNGCTNGKHTATSDAAFGLTVWGYDAYASYGYPAGMAVGAINTVIVPPVPE